MNDAMLDGLADFIDEFFNGVGCEPEDRTTGFALVFFPLVPGEPGPSGCRANVDNLEVDFTVTGGA